MGISISGIIQIRRMHFSISRTECHTFDKVTPKLLTSNSGPSQQMRKARIMKPMPPFQNAYVLIPISKQRDHLKFTTAVTRSRKGLEVTIDVNHGTLSTHGSSPQISLLRLGAIIEA